MKWEASKRKCVFLFFLERNDGAGLMSDTRLSERRFFVVNYGNALLVWSMRIFFFRVLKGLEASQFALQSMRDFCYYKTGWHQSRPTVRLDITWPNQRWCVFKAAHKVDSWCPYEHDTAHAVLCGCVTEAGYSALR
jgi:hypothetical protein